MRFRTTVLSGIFVHNIHFRTKNVVQLVECMPTMDEANSSVIILIKLDVVK